MRIALITSTFLPAVGGMEWKVHYLATEYSRRGHEVVVFAGAPKRSQRALPMPVVADYMITRCGVRLPGVERAGLTERLFCRAVLRHHQTAPFDVLHCHHVGPPTRYGVMVKQRVGVPVVATTCGGDVQVVPRIGYGDRLKPRFDRMVRDNVLHVDVIGSISRGVREELERIGTTARIVDIPNGLPWDDFQIGHSGLLRERFGLADRTAIVLSVGRNHPVKDYESGLRAFAGVRHGGGDAVYVLVGRGMSALAPVVDSLELGDRVHLVDEVPMEELAEFYHSADVLLSPSLIEGFSQVNVQAMACGLPCVVTDAPGNRDVAEHGCAVLAKPGDPESMTAALLELIHSPDRRLRLGEAGRKASRRYAWARIADDYLAVFAELDRPGAGCRTRATPRTRMRSDHGR